MSEARTHYFYPSQRMAVYANNLVATSQPLAVQAGLHAMRSGGNAIDAAVATAIAMTVLEPTGNGLGSDAFAIVWDGASLQGLNASGASPALWQRSHFDTYRTMPTHGWDSVTVPGAVSAWIMLSKAYGALPFASLFDAAVHYAESGYAVTPHISQLWQQECERLHEYTSFQQTFCPKGRAPHAGERVQLPDLAASLSDIASSDTDAFYQGRLAECIEKQAIREGGLMRVGDLARHESVWVRPLSIAFLGYEVCQMPPNTQGIITLIALGLLRHTSFQSYGVDSAESVDVQARALAWASKLAFPVICDPSIANGRYEHWLEDNILEREAKNMLAHAAISAYSPLAVTPGTIYLTTADQQGNMVSYIQSNYMHFGSGVVIDGTGITMSSRGSGFNLHAGHVNEVGPNKRPFHTLMPGFVMKQGEPVMSFGVMGGQMQPQGQLQMLVRVLGFDQNVQTASDAPRWRIEPDGVLWLEQGFSTTTAQSLIAMGHAVKHDVPSDQFGGGQYIKKLDQGYVGGSDHRKDGQASGF